jgi:hypothetical protein
MVEWLEGGDDSPPDLDVWHVEKDSYSFGDLFAFIQNEGTLEDADVGKKESSKRKLKEDDDAGGSKKKKKIASKVEKKSTSKKRTL